MPEELVRRPLKSRSQSWAKALAFKLIGFGLHPNQVSLGSVVFAVCAGVCFLMVPRATWLQQCLYLAGAACCIQLRLICNLIDGLMAVEGGKKSAVGEIYNELPDRFADVIIIVSAGCAVPGFQYSTTLAWTAASLALLTAYLRAFGGSMGFPQDYCGPMAKPHRMFTLTMASILGIVEVVIRQHTIMPGLALWVMIIGGLFTCFRRTQRIAQLLQKQ